MNQNDQIEFVLNWFEVSLSSPTYVRKQIKSNSCYFTTFPGQSDCAAYAIGSSAYAVCCSQYAVGCAEYVRHCGNKGNSVKFQQKLPV